MSYRVIQDEEGGWYIGDVHKDKNGELCLECMVEDSQTAEELVERIEYLGGVEDRNSDEDVEGYDLSRAILLCAETCSELRDKVEKIEAAFMEPALSFSDGKLENMVFIPDNIV